MFQALKSIKSTACPFFWQCTFLNQLKLKLKDSSSAFAVTTFQNILQVYRAEIESRLS